MMISFSLRTRSQPPANHSRAAGCASARAIIRRRDDFPNLLMQQPLLAFLADGDFFKLGVTHDNGVVVAGGDAGAELLAVVLLEVLFGCNKNVGGRVQTCLLYTSHSAR